MGLLIEIHLPTENFCIRMGKTNIQVDLIEFDKSLEDIERIKPEALSKYLKQKPKELKEIKDIEKLND